MTSVSDDALGTLARSSVELIVENQDAGGAYPASPAYRVYRYSWFRDGAFIADAMSRAGGIGIESASRFFDWCAGVINARASRVAALIGRARRGEAIGAAEHLPTRYTLDGDEADDEEWWDFQLDGYGTWIWALAAHLERHGRLVSDHVRAAVETCASYLGAFWDQPCYDWWEEHADGVHPSTLGAIHAGLRAAAGLVATPCASQCRATAEAISSFVLAEGLSDGHLVKTVGAGPRVDASLVACATPFGLVPPSGPVATATYAAVVEDLAPDGVHRYVGDTFYGGGRWVVLAGLVGWHEASTGRVDAARRRLEWMHAQATGDGLLPEQVTTHALDPTFVAPWAEKWGPVATPLLWSHAMYITLAAALRLLDD